MNRLVLAAFIAAICIPSSQAATDIEFILDVSGSMEKQLDGEKQLDSARNALKKALADIPPGQLVAIRAYGHRIDKANKEESCKDSELLVPFKEVDMAEVAVAVGSLQPRGYTPIAFTLGQARNDLYAVGVGRESERAVILLTDGEETCGGDSLALLKQMKEEGFDVTVYTIGFNVNDVAKKQLKEIADFSGGQYFDAKNSKQLNDALKTATQQSLVIEKEKAIYGSDIRGGDNYAAAVPIILDKELKLDHHQKAKFYDYFYVDLESGEEMLVSMNTLEKGISFNKDGTVKEHGHPSIGIQIHDTNRNSVWGQLIRGTKFKHIESAFSPSTMGRYYILVGVDRAMHKDHATFQISKLSKGDLDASADAGDTVKTALPVEMKRYDVNHLGGGDKKDMYYFDGTPGSKYFIGIIPQEELNGYYKINVFDEYKQVLFRKNSNTGQGIKVPEFEVPDEGRYFISIGLHNPKKSLPYTLILREKKIEKTE